MKLGLDRREDFQPDRAGYALFLQGLGIASETDEGRQMIEMLEHLDLSRQYQEIVGRLQKAHEAYVAKAFPGQTSPVQRGVGNIVLIAGGQQKPIPTLATITKGIVQQRSVLLDLVHTGFTRLSIFPYSLDLTTLITFYERALRETYDDEVRIVIPEDVENVGLVYPENPTPELGPSWRVTLSSHAWGALSPLAGEGSAERPMKDIVDTSDHLIFFEDVLDYFLARTSKSDGVDFLSHSIIAAGSRYNGNPLKVLLDPGEPDMDIPPSLLVQYESIGNAVVPASVARAFAIQVA